MRLASNPNRNVRFQHTLLPLLALTLLAFFLRVWQLNNAPPGWRDDELINSLVISQKAIDGDLAVYYPDASGHEALYHLLNAAMLALFGPGMAGIRLLSVFLGTLTVPLTFLVANRLFGRSVGLLAASLLAVSFWSLMYSRVGIRHISLPVFMLPAFYFFLRAIDVNGTRDQSKGYLQSWQEAHIPDFLLAGLSMGIGFYTYFASRGIPLILVAFCIYLLLFQRQRLHRRWPGLILTFAVAVLLAMPLLLTLGRQPESEARVEELAVPVVAVREGDFGPLLEHVGRTLSMFHSYGDEEWLYNIPLRPIFGPLAAIFFWSGVVIAVWYALRPLGRLLRGTATSEIGVRSGLDLEAAGAFVLIWWLAGISPGFISVPAASLGHTIIAQSATYILAALPILAIGRVMRHRFNQRDNYRAVFWTVTGIALLLLVIVAWRDLPDYYIRWPERGMTRFLYRADIRDLAEYINENPEMTDFGVGGFLAGPWDRLALDTDLQEPAAVRARWFNPERATLLTTGEKDALVFRSSVPGPAVDESSYSPYGDITVADFALYKVANQGNAKDQLSTMDEPICFENGLCVEAAAYDAESGRLSLMWQVSRELDLPDKRLISNPPPPGVYAGPRLLVFAQILNNDMQVLAGDDGLWVDESTLWPGDRFQQVHYLPAAVSAEGHTIIFGLYDPMTGQRVNTVDGRDHVTIHTTGNPEG